MVKEDGRMRYARWMETTVRPATQYTRRATLRAGRKGTGHIIGHPVQYWPDSPKSCEAADDLCADLERRAREAGYTILDDENE